VRAVLALWAGVLLGCAGADPCASLAPEAERRLEAFERFADVAERIVAADSAFDDRRVLEESIFHSLRDAPDVLGVWVERTGPAPLRLAHPRSSALPEGGLTACRVAGARLEVGRFPITVAETPGPALVLRRHTLDPPQDVIITMAFVVP
jgi:hypothetical protein